MQRQGGLKGLTVMAVTAEPGGEDIVERLKARGVSDLPFRVYSDPEKKLLARNEKGHQASLFVENLCKARKFESLTKVPYEDYRMVQPALVVIDHEGKVVQWWSWRKGPSRVLPVDKVSPMTKVPGYGPLVALRPRSEDIMDSIAERRPVRLQDQGYVRIIREYYGNPKFAVGVVAAASLGLAAAAGGWKLLSSL